MANKKNLPNIPIYIGDWQKDCAALSMEAQGGWLQIVFKLWTNGKQNTCKIPAKGLQILWRCSKEKMHEILDELIFNNIADISINKGFVEFTCRRFVKENELSEIRSGAAKSKNNKAKRKQNVSKTNTKVVQITDNDNENKIDNKSELKEKGGKGEKEKIDIEVFEVDYSDCSHHYGFPCDSEVTSFAPTFESEIEKWLIEEQNYLMKHPDRQLFLPRIKNDLSVWYKLKNNHDADETTLIEMFQAVIIHMDPWVKQKKFSLEYISGKWQEIFQGALMKMKGSDKSDNAVDRIKNGTNGYTLESVKEMVKQMEKESI